MKRTFLLSCLLLAFGCKDIMHVQTGYVSDRDECRSRSENNVGVYTQPDAYALNDKEKDTALLQLFCECMKGKDWKVAGCPKPAPVVAQTPAPTAPTVVVVQSPTAQPAYLPAPVEAAPAPVAAGAPVKHRRKVCTPPGTCPAPTDYLGSGGAAQTPVQSDSQLQGILQRQ